MRDYGKVYSAFWSSETTAGMSNDGKMLALYLMTCSHSTIAGVFRMPDGYAAEDLGWTPERVQQGFVELFESGFANRCLTTKWVWVVKHLDWNKPENPNQIKSARKIALGVPDACVWKALFMRASREILAFPDAPPDNPSGTLGEGLPNQNQKQDQNQNEEPSAPSADKLPTCRYDDIVNLYHEVLPELPRVKVMDDERKGLIKKRWQWTLTSKRPDGSRRATNADESLIWFRSYFETTRDNDFLMGRARKSPGHENWKCDIDYLMKSAALKKVMEQTVTEDQS